MNANVVMNNGRSYLLDVGYEEFMKAIKNNLENGIAFQEAQTILGVKISLKISEISEVLESQF
jgi:hypothetical protein